MNVNSEVARIMDDLARIDKELAAEEKAKLARIAERRQEAEFKKDLENRMKEIEL